MPPSRTEDARRRLLDERNVWLSCLRRDGSPHLTPIWFVYHDTMIWLCCSEKAAKTRNVARDSRVSVALQDGDHPLVAEGNAAVFEDAWPQAVVHEFARKYEGWDITTHISEGERRVLLGITINRWLYNGRSPEANLVLA